MLEYIIRRICKVKKPLITKMFPTENPIHHIGIILDGNRRYAKKVGKTKLLGHRQGAQNVRKLITQWAPKLAITELTLYTFSIQNFEREKSEVEYLMELFKEFFKKILQSQLTKKNIKIQFIGRRHLFSDVIQEIMNKLETKTKENTGLLVRFAMAYGGREEIIDAVNNIFKSKTTLTQNQTRQQQTNGITAEDLSKYMYMSSEPDLIIRTGGDHRTSNFLIWQSWYSEWFFIEKFWPEFTFEDLQKITEEFAKRKRTFGK